MDYTDLAKQALAAIADFGAIAVLSREEKGAFDPSTGEYTEPTTASYSVRALLKVPDLMGSGERFREGTAVRDGDLSATVPAHGLSIVPRAGDKFVVGGDTYIVDSNKVVGPGGVPILFKLSLKK